MPEVNTVRLVKAARNVKAAWSICRNDVDSLAVLSLMDHAVNEILGAALADTGGREASLTTPLETEKTNRRVLDVPPINVEWVSVDEELPPLGRPVLLWGTRLMNRPELEHPLLGCLCACHEQWVLHTEPEEGDDDYTDRMLGTVTHWLRWWPAPGWAREETP